MKYVRRRRNGEGPTRHHGPSQNGMIVDTYRKRKSTGTREGREQDGSVLESERKAKTNGWWDLVSVRGSASINEKNSPRREVIKNKHVIYARSMKVGTAVPKVSRTEQSHCGP